MRAIRFPDTECEAEGLRVIAFAGTFVYTGRSGWYRVPNYICDVLAHRGVPFEVLKEGELAEEDPDA